MPISRQEFEDGRLDLGVPIVRYLSIRGEEAFTADEILYALTEVYERRATPAEVVMKLQELVDSVLVESKIVAGVRVYTIVVGE